MRRAEGKRGRDPPAIDRGPRAMPRTVVGILIVIVLVLLIIFLLQRT
jgi:hypothetical protein